MLPSWYVLLEYVPAAMESECTSTRVLQLKVQSHVVCVTNVALPGTSSTTSTTYARVTLVVLLLLQCFSLLRHSCCNRMLASGSSGCRTLRHGTANLTDPQGCLRAPPPTHSTPWSYSQRWSFQCHRHDPPRTPPTRCRSCCPCGGVRARRLQVLLRLLLRLHLR